MATRVELAPKQYKIEEKSSVSQTVIPISNVQLTNNNKVDQFVRRLSKVSQNNSVKQPATNYSRKVDIAKSIPLKRTSTFGARIIY